MPVQDVEMGKQAPVARVPKKIKARKGQFRLPVTVGLSFVGLFLFFVILGSSSSKEAANGASGSNGKLKNAAGGGKPSKAAAGAGGQPKVYSYKVVKEFPHDTSAFLQGLQYDRICEQGSQDKCRDVFWESTGLNGRSTVREVELETGRVLRSKKLPQSDFGEGVTRHGDRLYQVTWMSPKTWSYSVGNFEERRELATPLKDGWGITSDGTHLIVGDSSEVLTWVDPDSMQSVRQVAVTDAGKPVKWLNELEYIDGLVWANIWQTDCIAQIDPQSGAVVGWVRLSGLRQRALEAAAADARNSNSQQQRGPREQPEVVNGIAYDADRQRLFVSGKLWPRVYQIEVAEGAAVGATGEAAAAALQEARQQCIVHAHDLHGFFM